MNIKKPIKLTPEQREEAKKIALRSLRLAQIKKEREFKLISIVELKKPKNTE